MALFNRLFEPVAKRANILEIRTEKECRALFAQEFAVIFKHSKSCNLSQHAYRTVLEFCAERPDANIHLLCVIGSRAAALFVEEQTGVRHESPQLLAMRYGTVFAHASHQHITPGFLEKIHQA
ncbi:MAG: monothiol bacilliredoxin BrxC family protein [Bryobacteraceae bacterium]